MANIKPTPEIYYTSLKYFARFTQFLAWPFAFIFFNIFFNLKINGRENLKKINSPFILISNHVSFYDSFVFRLVMGVFSNKLPLRFMAVNSFNFWYLNFLSRIYITDIIYALFGVFVVVKGRGIEKNLMDAVRIIENGGNVVIYPEGSIIHNNMLGSFKQGAAVLAKKTHVSVLPVSMRLIGNNFRRKYIVNIGNVIDYHSRDSIKDITNLFHDEINKLYKLN